MKRILLTAVAIFTLAAVPAAAQHGPPDGYPSPRGADGFEPPFAEEHPVPWAFRGVVQSVDSDAGTLVANARLMAGPPRGPEPGDDPRGHGDHGQSDQDQGDPGEEPGAGAANAGVDADEPADGADGPDGDDARHERQLLTFHTGEQTHVTRNGREVGLEDLRRGDMVYVMVFAPRDATMEEVTATPAMFVGAFAKPRVYGFGGRVRSVDTEAGTITIRVRHMTRDARRLARRHDSRLMTFAIGEHTLVERDGESAELADFAPGDLAGVGYIGARRTTLEELLALPADVLVGASGTRAERRTTARLSRSAARGARRMR